MFCVALLAENAVRNCLLSPLCLDHLASHVHRLTPILCIYAHTIVLTETCAIKANE